MKILICTFLLSTSQKITSLFKVRAMPCYLFLNFSPHLSPSKKSWAMNKVSDVCEHNI